MNKLQLKETIMETAIDALSKAAREQGFSLLHFHAGGSEIIELQVKNLDIYHCIGIYSSEDKNKPYSLYERATKKNEVSEHLFRLYGPTHIYGRGSDPYLTRQKTFEQGKPYSQEYFRDLKEKINPDQTFLEKFFDIAKRVLIPVHKNMDYKKRIKDKNIPSLTLN
jgi:hypothetical protein